MNQYDIPEQPHVPPMPEKITAIKKCKYLLPCGMCDYLIQINSKNKICSQYGVVNNDQG